MTEPFVDQQIDQVLADNQAIAKAAEMAINAWPWSHDALSEGTTQVIDHGWDWSPDILGGNEWRRPTTTEMAIHMMRILESLRGPDSKVSEVSSGHIRMWTDDDDKLHIDLEMV